MSSPVHIAVTRRIRKECISDFERALGEFAIRSMAEPGARGVHCVYPPPGSDSTEYGILRSFASDADLKAFYESMLYRHWLEEIDPMAEGDASCRDLSGLEAWFRDPTYPRPPVWKMALLTWIAVWPLSMLVPAVVRPFLGSAFPPVLAAGFIASGIVFLLTWVAMPFLIKLTHSWLRPRKVWSPRLPKNHQAHTTPSS